MVLPSSQNQNTKQIIYIWDKQHALRAWASKAWCTPQSSRDICRRFRNTACRGRGENGKAGSRPLRDSTSDSPNSTAPTSSLLCIWGTGSDWRMVSTNTLTQKKASSIKKLVLIQAHAVVIQYHFHNTVVALKNWK